MSDAPTAGVSSTLLTQTLKWLEMRHGDRLMDQDTFNRIVVHLGAVERLFCEMPKVEKTGARP